MYEKTLGSTMSVFVSLPVAGVAPSLPTCREQTITCDGRMVACACYNIKPRFQIYILPMPVRLNLLHEFWHLVGVSDFQTTNLSKVLLSKPYCGTFH